MGKFLDKFKEGVQSVSEGIANVLDVDNSGSIGFGDVTTGLKNVFQPKVIDRQIESQQFLDQRKQEKGFIDRQDFIESVAQPSISEAPLAGPAGGLFTKVVGKGVEEFITKPVSRFGATTSLSIDEKITGERKEISPSPLSTSLFGSPIIEAGGEVGEVKTFQEQTESLTGGTGLSGRFVNFLSEKTGIQDEVFAVPLLGLVTLADIWPDNFTKVRPLLKSKVLTQTVRAKYGDEAVNVLDGFRRGENVENVRPEILDAVIDEIEIFTKQPPNTTNILRKIDEGKVETIARPSDSIKITDDAAGGLPSVTRKIDNTPFDVIKGTDAEKKRLASLNLEKIKTSDDAKAIIENVSKEFQTGIVKQTRGVISFDDASKMSKLIDLTPEQIVKLPPGSILNAETMEAARSMLATSAEKLERVTKAVVNNPTPEALQDFENVLKTHTDIQSAVTGVKAELGRALGAQRKKVGAQTQTAQRLQDFIELRSRMQKATGTKSPEQASVEFAKKLLTAAENPEMMSKMVAELRKPTFLEKMVEFSVAAKLWTPTTHLVNLMSNTATALMRPFEKGTTAAFDWVNATLTGKKRERFFAEGMHDVYGTAAAFTQGFPDALRGFINDLSFGQFVKTLEDSGGAVGDFIASARREEFGRDLFGKGLEVAGTREGAIGGRFGKVVRTPFRFLQASDNFFKNLNQTAELHSLAYRQAIQEGTKGEARKLRIAELIKLPSDEMLEVAQKKAKEFLFQEEMGKAGKALEGFRTQVPWIKFVIPFLKTPVNVAKFSFRRSPAGILSPKNWKDIKAGGGQRAEAMARIAMGSLVSAAVVSFVDEGKITGKAPKDAAERDKFFREGKLPYAIKIGDKWVQYQRLEPFASFLALGANVSDKIKRQGEEATSELIAELVFETAKQYTDQTFLMGLSQTMDAINDPDRYGKKFAQSLITGQIPSFIPFAARVTDRTIRDPETIPEAVASKIPFLSKTIRPRLNVFGEEATRAGGFFNETSPVKISQEKDDKVENELDRLNIKINFPSDSITRSGHTIKLNPNQKNDLVETTGRLTKLMMDKVVDSPGWDDMDDEAQSDIVDDIIKKARDVVRDEMLVDAELERLKFEASDNPVQEEVLRKLILKDDYSELDDNTRRRVIQKLKEKTGG